MHFLGIAGMPRRVADYPDGFAGWNLIASIGGGITLAATAVFLFAMLSTLLSGRPAQRAAWGIGATTLEWQDETSAAQSGAGTGAPA